MACYMQARSTPSSPPQALVQRSAIGIVGRESLVARLVEARGLRCIAITGPAGAGKSTLAAAWRQAVVPLGFHVAWYSATARDDEPAPFLDGLLASLAGATPAPARQAVRWDAGGVDHDAVERFAISLVQAVEAHPRELALVLDDVHHLRHPMIRETLQWLLDYAPPNLHLMLISRGRPGLSLDRLRSRSQSLELNAQDLQFTPEETVRFLQAHVGCADARTARTLHSRSGGWVAGVRMLAQQWKKNKQLGAPMPACEALPRYFEQELLSQLPPGAIDLLVRAASCERFSAPLCAALMGAPDGVAAAAALLERLESDDLFVARIEDQPVDAWYRLHPLLRETLQERFSALDEDTRHAVHARAFGWFRAKGLLQEAVPHAVQSGQSALAANLVDRCALSFALRGERRELLTLLRLLPPEHIQQDLRMRLWLARTQFFERDLDACSKTLESLAQDLPTTDAVLRFHVQILQVALAVQRDDVDSALAMQPRLLQVPDGTEPLAMGARNNIMSWLFALQGRYDEARCVILDAPTILIDGAPLVGTPAGSLQGRTLVGLSYALEGRMTQAERIFRAVIAEAVQRGDGCADARYLALSLLSDVLYELDEASEARRLLQDKLTTLERVAMPEAVLRVYRVLAAAYWQAGQPEGAFAHLDKLAHYAAKHGLDRLLAYSLCDRVHYHLLLGGLTAAEAARARLDEIDARHVGSAPAVGGEISEAAQRARIRLAATLGELDSAGAQIASLIAQCEQRGRQRVVVHLIVQGAAIEARRGRYESARRKLLEALRRGHRLGLLRSVVDAVPTARRMVAEIAHTELLDPVLAFYVQRLLAVRARPGVPRKAINAPPSPRAAALGELQALGEREIEMLRLLAQAMPNKKIARALGLSPETVKWYLSRIYGKLHVSGRDEAVARLRDLGWEPEGAAAAALKLSRENATRGATGQYG